MENELKVFIKRYESVMAPLRREAADTYFKASVTGDEALYKKAGECEVAISKIYARKDDFAFLKKAKEAGSVKDGLLKRELEVLYDSYLVYQGDEKKIEEIINKEMEVTQKFSVFRAEYKGKKITDNEVNKVLRESKDSGDLKEVWESHKSIGKLVAGSQCLWISRIITKCSCSPMSRTRKKLAVCSMNWQSSRRTFFLPKRKRLTGSWRRNFVLMRQN